jgi:acyl dehydratase
MSITAGTKISGRVKRTLDVGDFSMLHQLLWFNMAIHSDSEYGKTTWFKERSLAAPVIFAVVDGLIHNADTISELLENNGYSIYAYVGVDNVKFTKPVLFGDTLRSEATVVDFKATKNPKMNLLVYNNKAYNQRNDLVVEYTSTMMCAKKD